MPEHRAPAQTEATSQQRIRIVLFGDSTVNAAGGWSPGFCARITPNVTSVNLARNRRTSKNYYDQDLWPNALAQRADYILIQFGHSDMPGKGPPRETDPDTTYAANMRRYIEQARAAGAPRVTRHVTLPPQLSQQPAHSLPRALCERGQTGRPTGGCARH